MLDHIRKGDVVVVWKLDRLTHPVPGLLYILDRIAGAGAGFRSLGEQIDTTTPAGRMMMRTIGSVVDFGRAMIRERTLTGLAAVHAERRVGGRSPKLDYAKRRRIAEDVTSGRNSGAEMARLYAVSQATVSRIAAQHRARIWAADAARSPRKGAAEEGPP